MSPDATRTTGRWLAITTPPGGANEGSLFADAVRVDVAGQPATYVTTSGNVFTMRFTATDASSFEATGFGFGLDEIIRIATTVQRQRGVADGIDYGDLAGESGPLESLAPSSATITAWVTLATAMLEKAESFATYFSVSGNGYVGIGTAIPSSTDEVLLQLLTQPWAAAIADGFGTETTVVADDGSERQVTLGSIPELGIAAARWRIRANSCRSSPRTQRHQIYSAL